MEAPTPDPEGLSRQREVKAPQKTLTTSNQGARENMIGTVDRKPHPRFESLSNLSLSVIALVCVLAN